MFQRTIMNILKNKITFALAVTVMGLSACSDNKEKQAIAQTEQQEAAVETPQVELVSVEKGKLTSSITVPGELIQYQEVDIYAKINSYVKKLYVDIGSQVHQGELLAALDAPEINSQIAAAESHVKQQEAVYYA